MAVTLPDINALGRRPVPMGNRGFAQQDTASPGAAVAQLGQTIGQVGGALVAEFQQRDDEQKVLEYRRKLIDWDKTNVHDPENGAVSKLGKDAFDLPNTLPKAFDEFAATAAKDLSSPRQRKIAQEMAMGRREQIINWASGHALRQRDVFDTQEYQANVASFKDQATLYPALAERELAEMAKATQSYMGKRFGPEAVAAKIKADASEVHARIVSGMVKDGNVAGAEAHFKANAADMNSAARDVAQGLLKEVGTRQKVQAFEDGIRATDMPLSQALDQARTQFVSDPVARDAAVAQVKTLYAEREAVKTQSVKQVATDAWSVLMEKGTMSAIPSSTMTALRKNAPEEERQMRDWLEAKWRRAKADAEGKRSEDWGTFMALADMANDNPEKFLDPQTLLKAEPHLSKQQMGALVSMRTGMNKGDMKAQNLMKMSKDVESFIMADLKVAGIDTTPKDGDKKGAELLQKFRGELRMALDAAQQEKGRALSPKESQEIGLAMVRTGIEQGSGWFFGLNPTKKRGFEMEPGKTYITKRFGDIPQDDRRGLIESMARRKNLERSIYGDRDYILSAEDKAEIERAYQRGVEAGVIKP